MSQVITESLISEMRVQKSQDSKALCIMEGPCMEFGIVNQNNRIYSKSLIENRILKNSQVQEALKNKSMLGEGGHPENRLSIYYPEVALSVEKLWIPEGSNNQLYGRFAILDTPVGRIINSLVQYGSKIGISARAVADVFTQNGHDIVDEASYNLITFDAVPDPGFKNARISVVEGKDISKMSLLELQQSKETLSKLNNSCFESQIYQIDREMKSRRDESVSLEDTMSLVNQLRLALSGIVDSLKCSNSHASIINNEIPDGMQLVNELIPLVQEMISYCRNERASYVAVKNDRDRLNESTKYLLNEIHSIDTLNYNNANIEFMKYAKRFEGLISRLESLTSSGGSDGITRNDVEKLSKKFGINESRIVNLASTSDTKNSRELKKALSKISCFESDGSKLIRSNEDIVDNEDALSFLVRSQFGRRMV